MTTAGLTPETARAAAEWLARGGRIHSADALREEADRLEAAAKTPGEVLAEEMGYENWLRWSDATRASYENYAAAVIAHHVGPDRVVVDQDDLDAALNDPRAKPSVIDRLREALS